MERATISRQQQTQRAFLGAALMDPARAREYIIKLVPGMFDEGVSRAVFSAVQQLTMAGEPVDVITVINRASAGRPADEIRPGVVAMAETCPSVSNIGSYAAQILEDYRYSLLQGDLMKCMAKDAMDSDGVCRQLRRTLAVQDAIRSTQTDSTARDFDAVLDSALARLDEPDDSLKLGWPELDRYGVFGRQRVCVVAGRPGCGKTDFSLNLAARLSKRYKVYYLTLEETADEMLVAMEQSGLSAKTINKTREKLTEVVLPYVDDLRNPNGGLKNAGNPQNVRDGDIWVQAYLVARGIKAFDVPEVDYGEDHV